METKVEEQPTIVDTAKLALSIVIVLGGLVAYYYFGDSSTLLRTRVACDAASNTVGLASCRGGADLKNCFTACHMLSTPIF